MATLSYRPAAEADVPFLVELRRSTMRLHELASGVNRSAEQSMQRVMQSLEIAQVIEQAGQAIGVLKGLRDGAQWELYQIQLMPQFQGQGIGAQIIGSLIAEARTAGVGLRLGVLRANPARKLYERLGFVVVSEKEHGYEMALGA
jgi:ribosomal protein S18 acetylase RimI-like enzyme